MTHGHSPSHADGRRVVRFTGMSATIVLFDVDGTLIDPAGAGRGAVFDALQEVFGVSRQALEDARVRFAGRTDPRILRSLARAVAIPDERLRAHFERYVDAYVSHLRARLQAPTSRCRVLPGVEELLDTLRAHGGVYLGLVTGNLERGAHAKLERFGLDRYFEDGGYSSDDEDRATIARIARERLERRHGLRLAPERIVVVGDTELDVACARANGFRSVAVGTGGATAERMTSWGCDAWLEDLADARAAWAAFGLDEELLDATRG
jgi:phosphoglycolate phosphatase-like HAD superfamily hydrolase